MKNSLTKKELGMRWFNCFYKFILPINMFSLLGNTITAIQTNLYLNATLCIIDLMFIIITYIIYFLNRKKSFDYPITLYYLTLCWGAGAALINVPNGLMTVLSSFVILFIPNVIYFTKRKHLYK